MAVTPLHKQVTLADFVTLLNAFVGIAAILAAAQHRIDLAAALILLGILVDGLDGATARLFGGGPLGGTLDALSDAITFAAAPAVLIIESGDDWLSYAGGAMFLMGGLFRLARFESIRNGEDPGHFWGISTPGGAILVAGTLLVGAPATSVAGTAIVAAMLMTTSLPYPKLRGALGIAGVLVILGALVAFGLGHGDYGGWAMLAFMVAYTLGGPAYVRRS